MCVCVCGAYQACLSFGEQACKLLQFVAHTLVAVTSAAQELLLLCVEHGHHILQLCHTRPSLGQVSRETLNFLLVIARLKLQPLQRAIQCLILHLPTPDLSAPHSCETPKCGQRKRFDQIFDRSRPRWERSSEGTSPRAAARQILGVYLLHFLMGLSTLLFGVYLLYFVGVYP